MKRYEIYSSFMFFRRLLNCYGLIQSLNMSRLKVDTSSTAAISRPAGSAFRKMDGDLGINYQSEASKKGCTFWKFERKWNLQQPSVSVSYPVDPVESHSSIGNFQWLHLNDCYWPDSKTSWMPSGMWPFAPEHLPGRALEARRNAAVLQFNASLDLIAF